ncbi:hypothetical protein D3C81_2204930 [compost metagenome]
MQAIDHIRQLTLVGQLGLIEHSLDHDGPGGILQRHQAFALGAGGSQRDLIRAQGFIQQ